MSWQKSLPQYIIGVKGSVRLEKEMDVYIDYNNGQSYWGFKIIRSRNDITCHASGKGQLWELEILFFL